MTDVPDQSLLNWVLGGVVVIVSTLAGVVSLLYRAAETRNARDINELKGQVSALDTKLDETEAARLECEKDRASLRATCDLVTDRVAKLEKLVTERTT